MVSFKLKIAVLLITVVFLVVINLTLSSEIRNFFYSISAPIQIPLRKLSNEISGWSTTIFNLSQVKKEIQELREENLALLSENIELKKLKQENKFLREALDLNLQEDFKLVLAQVIGRSTDPDYILINRGVNDKVEKGMPVIDSQRVVWGKIDKVHQNYSLVKLISNPELSFSAQVKDKKIKGRVEGKSSHKLGFDFIPQHKKIAKNDILITSSLGKFFPQGLLVGEIKKINKSDLEPFQTAVVEPFFDIKNMTVLIVKN